MKILGLFSYSSKMLVLEKANNNRIPRGLFEGNGSLENSFTNTMISECSVWVDNAVLSPRRFKIVVCIWSWLCFHIWYWFYWKRIVAGGVLQDLKISPCLIFRFSFSTHTFHSARKAWDNLDSFASLWLRRWLRAHTRVPVPSVCTPAAS